MRRNLVGVLECVGVVVAGLALRGAVQETSGAIPVCVGADRVLRAVENEQPCPAGSQRFVLASPSVESELKNQELKKPAPAPDLAVRRLEERVRQLEKEVASGGTGNTVTAPFVVVDRAGKALLRVDEKVPESGPGAARVMIGAGVNDNFAVRVFNSAGVVMGGVGESRTGGGLVSAFDAEGNQRAALNGRTGAITAINKAGKVTAELITNDEGKGEVRALNESEKPVAILMIGARGGGVLRISDPSGTPMVEAGTHQDGYGVVRAGPISKVGGFAGLISSFLMGYVK